MSETLPKTLTRAKLADILYDSHGLNRNEAKELVDIFFQEMCDMLDEHQTLKLRNFGSFHVRKKKERVGRNPKTGKEFKISSRKVVRFRASKKLRGIISEASNQSNDGKDDGFEFVSE